MKILIVDILKNARKQRAERRDDTWGELAGIINKLSFLIANTLVTIDDRNR